jgi:hypothetical protein
VKNNPFKRSATVKYAAKLARETASSLNPQPSTPSTITDEIVWHPATDKPDTDITVLIATKDADEPIWLGYWASEDNEWRTIEGSAVTVTHWAHLPDHPCPSVPIRG